MKIRHVGTGYHGTDGEKSVSAVPGEIIEVSQAKHQQLMDDFPDEWEPIDVEPRTKPAGPNRRKAQ